MYIQSAGSNDSNISKQRIVQKNVDKSFLAKVVLLTCYLKFEPKTENFYSGAPSRAKRAWDRAPYSWNMVNLFSFGCHVTDRAYVRTYVRVYRLYGWGRGDYQKEGRGASGVSWQVHIFYIEH